jgi:cellulose synthase/poly-beta-1,6-N-acetylglucosamine synthase-like glycosyltransferase
MDIHALYDWSQATFQTAFEKYSELGRPTLDLLHIVFDNLFYFFLYVMAFACFTYLFMAFYTAVLKNKPSAPLDASYTPSVTIQIPTFNEPVAIRCAEACLKFDYPNSKFHILIGDDSNQADVSKKLKEFASKHAQVQVIKREKNIGYKPGNLNNMLPHSKGEFLVIFDSDYLPKPDFLKRIVQPFKHDDMIAATQARWTFINGGQNFITILGTSILNVYHYVTLPYIKNRKKMSLLCGSAEAIRKSTLIKLGGWDTGNLTEDIEYSIRMVNNGYRVEYIEDLTCDSEAPHTPKDLYKQQTRWAYGVISSFKKHFKPIVFNKKTTFEHKFCLGLVGCGYLISFVLLAMLSTGFLSIITHAPAPIQWSLFLKETFTNIAITSGLILTTIVAMKRSHTLKQVPPMVASSFSFGIVMTYYVNKGIFKAILGRPMEWFMLSKQSNDAYSSKA